MRLTRFTGSWAEEVLLFAVVAGFAYSIGHLLIVGYLPQPFFYNVSDTWMDWFNTSLWAHDSGAYDVWNSIYPPFTFVFLKLFSLPGCYLGTSGDARSCDWVGKVTLFAFYLLNIVLVSRCYVRIDRRTALPRAIAMAIGLPMATALDRGNVVLVCFTFFALAYGPLLRSARLRWLCAGVTINFKVYLVAAVFPQLLKRRWLWFEGAVLSAIGIYLVAWGIYGDGSPLQVFRNIVDFSDATAAQELLDGWFASSYSPIQSVLTQIDTSSLKVLGSDVIEYGDIFITLFRGSVQALIVLASLAAWLRPERVPMYRLTNLGTCLSLLTAEAVGYSLPFALFLTFMEPWRGAGRKIALVCAYLLCVEADMTIYTIAPTGREGFFIGRYLYVEAFVSIGPIIRPALLLLIAAGLACTTCREVWGDIRAQGWRARQRFRHDLPLLAAGGAAPAV